MNRAWLEKQFDAGRYNIICSTGELPPNLQGVWGGTYVPGWASDYTHNGNVPVRHRRQPAWATLPELMLAYINYIESLVPDMEHNAKPTSAAAASSCPRAPRPTATTTRSRKFRRRHVDGRRAMGRAFLLRLLPLHRRREVPRRARAAVHGKSRLVLRGLRL
jgi:hypothetical protein